MKANVRVKVETFHDLELDIDLEEGSFVKGKELTEKSLKLVPDLLKEKFKDNLEFMSQLGHINFISSVVKDKVFVWVDDLGWVSLNQKWIIMNDLFKDALGFEESNMFFDPLNYLVDMDDYLLNHPKGPVDCDINDFTKDELMPDEEIPF